MRLDEYLVSQHPQYSRSYLAKLNKNGRVTVNGIYRKSSFDVTEDDRVVIDFSSEETSYPTLELPILYEDQDVVVIFKPSGVLTHSKGAYNPEPTAATWLADRLRSQVQRTKNKVTSAKSQVSNKNEADLHVTNYKLQVPDTRDSELETRDFSREGIVHRLDRATSGVMILAKNDEALSFLQKQFSQRKTKKTYVAVVEGRLKDERARIEWPLDRDPKKPQTFRVHPNGKSAITEYEVLKVLESHKFGSCSVVKLRPETGRTHQLRVHMAHLGHPIIGDPLYKGKTADRLYLHALSLEITLPNKERKVFEAPLPKEFEEV